MPSYLKYNVLRRYIWARKIKLKEIMQAMGITKPTCISLLTNPETMTIEDMERLANVLDIDYQDVHDLAIGDEQAAVDLLADCEPEAMLRWRGTKRKK